MPAEPHSERKNSPATGAPAPSAAAASRSPAPASSPSSASLASMPGIPRAKARKKTDSRMNANSGSANFGSKNNLSARAEGGRPGAYTPASSAASSPPSGASSPAAAAGTPRSFPPARAARGRAGKTQAACPPLSPSPAAPEAARAATGGTAAETGGAARAETGGTAAGTRDVLWQASRRTVRRRATSARRWAERAHTGMPSRADSPSASKNPPRRASRSRMVTTSAAGRPSARTCRTSARARGRVSASATHTARSYSPACAARLAAPSSMLYVRSEYRPGRSTTSAGSPARSAAPASAPTVTPCQLPVLAWPPVSALNSVDLPQFGLPSSSRRTRFCPRAAPFSRPFNRIHPPPPRSLRRARLAGRGARPPPPPAARRRRAHAAGRAPAPQAAR